MRLAAQLFLSPVERCRIELRGRPAGGSVFLDRTPETLEKTRASLHALVGPLERLLRRRRKHHEEPDRVRAETLDQFLRVNRVALVLGHFRAVFQHHALCQEVGERLRCCGQVLVAHDPLEKARIEEVQDGVLDASRVLVHRHPV